MSERVLREEIEASRAYIQALRQVLYAGDPNIRMAARSSLDALSSKHTAAMTKVDSAAPGDDLPALQERVAAWVRTRIGEAHMHHRERAMRLFEEAVELVQAEGIRIDQAEAQLYHVYGRPAGDPAQEAAGTIVGILGWCAATGNYPIDLARAEVERIEAKPLDQIRGSLARKFDADLVTVVPTPAIRLRVADESDESYEASEALLRQGKSLVGLTIPERETWR